MRSILAVVLVAGCGFSHPEDVPYDADMRPLVLTSISGDGQRGAAGTPLPSPFVVGLTRGGEPLPAQMVSFVVTAGNGAVSQTTVATDETGQASSTLTLGPALGANSVQATLVDDASSVVEFAATAASGPPAKLTLTSGNNQTVQFWAPTKQALVVTVTDAFDNPAPGVAVAFTATAGGGSFETAAPATDDTGHAQTKWIVGGPGVNTATARVTGVADEALFSANVTTYASGQSHNTGLGRTTFAVAVDLNADGKPDLALSGETTGGTGVILPMLNNTPAGSSTIGLTANSEATATNLLNSVIAGDLNGDGKLDLVASSGADDLTSCFVNTTTAGASVTSFQPAANVNTLATNPSTVLADINGDGKLDLVGLWQDGTNDYVVTLNTTPAGSTTVTFGASTRLTKVCGLGLATAQRLAVADFNADGKPDIAVACGSTSGAGIGGVGILLNTTAAGASTPTFALTAFHGINHHATLAIAIGDFNHDGKPDVACANDDAPATASVMLNTTTAGGTTPTFTPMTELLVGNGAIALVVADLNGDGRPDIATANKSGTSISVLANRTPTGATTPVFAPNFDLPAPAVPTAITATDLNADGKSDLVITSDTSVVVYPAQ